ncbi:MAG: pantoate--beta-alanine ligase [Thermodesulfobacteriota bacterium]
MKIVREIEAMREITSQARLEGVRIALVPTMGYLHEGHVALLRRGRELGGLLVMTSFVNPTQFGPSEDFADYPRDVEGDMRKAEQAGVDVVFMPEGEALYPEGFQTFVEVSRLQKHLCGLSRPGHFVGVATVVLKLFNIVGPHTAVFGEKDYQQLAVIRRMVSDLHLDIAVVSHPIVREADGLAMSSRNSYLTTKERGAALSLYLALRRGMELFENGERDAAVVMEAMKEILLREPTVAVEYVKVCNRETLDAIDNLNDGALLAVAAGIGRTRLIDNVVVRKG